MFLSGILTRIISLLVFLSIGIPAYAAIGPHKNNPTLRVIIPLDENPNMEHIQYYHKLLNLALAKTQATDGDFVISTSPKVLNYERYLRELQQGKIDVMWTNNNAERERELRAIPVSIIKDLNSYRILIIRKEDQPVFDQIETLGELRELKCGLGTQWPDTVTMRDNGFTVITAIRQDSLFKMLASKRFDYFPRGLYEVWREAEENKNSGLVIEKRLMIYYKSPIYFFVRKDDIKLADRIERGLKIAQADGSFDELFFSMPGFKRGYEEQVKGGRKLFILNSTY